ncbi:uncharacterized protein VTP21DRAFT_10008 [Calcarisporiella thermophila]|uniref:uncharacterized protein n=1 Tax=Calcarisporiella thermophila TaxID=911321 RepID=UPI003743AAAA
MDDNPFQSTPSSTPSRQIRVNNILSPTSTPFINRLNDAEVRRCLRDAYRMIKEKDRDLILAAEIGQSLLEKNDALAMECERLHRQFAAHAQQQSQHPPEPAAEESSDTSTKRCEDERHDVLAALADDLERANADLRKELEQANRRADEASKQGERRIKKLAGEFDQIKAQLDKQFRINEELEEQKQRLAREKAALVRERAEMAKGEVEGEKLQSRVYELEELIETLTVGRTEAEERMESLSEEVAILQEKCVEYQEQLEDLEHLKDTCEQQSVQIAELNASLEESRETIHALNARLSMLEPESENGSNNDGVTLFSEVEDRRVELENKNKHLSQAHAGLLKAHSLSVHQQERMRNHISRLTQLASSKSNEARLRRLEQALGQTQSENQLLQAKLTQMQRSAASSVEYIKLDDPESKDDLIESLQMRVEQLAADGTRLRKELQTAHMLKLGEAEKVREAQAALHSREIEIEQLKAANAQIRFELDEMHLKVQMIMEKANAEEADSDEDADKREEGAKEKDIRRAPMGTQSKSNQLSSTDGTKERPKSYGEQRGSVSKGGRERTPQTQIRDGLNRAKWDTDRPAEERLADDNDTERSISVEEEGLDADVDDISSQCESTRSEGYDSYDLPVQEGSTSDFSSNSPESARALGSPQPKKLGGSPHPRKLGIRSNGPPLRNPPPTKVAFDSHKPKQLYVTRQNVQANECNQQ